MDMAVAGLDEDVAVAVLDEELAVAGLDEELALAGLDEDMAVVGIKMTLHLNLEGAGRRTVSAAARLDILLKIVCVIYVSKDDFS